MKQALIYVDFSPNRQEEYTKYSDKCINLLQNLNVEILCHKTLLTNEIKNTSTLNIKSSVVNHFLPLEDVVAAIIITKDVNICRKSEMYLNLKKSNIPIRIINE